MNIYRDDTTGRLVRVYRVSPRMMLGSWFEQEDLANGATRKISSFEHLTLVGED